VARALKEKLTCSIENCKQFSGFLKTVRQTIAVGDVISPLEQAQKKRNDDNDEICVIDAMAKMKRSETPREIGIHIREKQKGKKKTARSTRVLSLAPQNTPHTPRSTATRTPQNANEDPRRPRGPWASLGYPLAFGTCFWHLGHAFDSWDFIPILNVNIIF
jgi:hypothetical protein